MALQSIPFSLRHRICFFFALPPFLYSCKRFSLRTLLVFKTPTIRLHKTKKNPKKNRDAPHLPSGKRYKWHVSDCHSLNGTFIDCVKVGDSEIHDGETLTLGGVWPSQVSAVISLPLTLCFVLSSLTRQEHLRWLQVGYWTTTRASRRLNPLLLLQCLHRQAPAASPVSFEANNLDDDEPKSDMDEGEGKEGDDDDEDISELNASSGSRRKRSHQNSQQEDTKRRKFEGNGGEASAAPSDGALASKPSMKAKTDARDGANRSVAAASSAAVAVASPNQVRNNSMKDELKCAVCYDFFLMHAPWHVLTAFARGRHFMQQLASFL